MIDLNLYRSRIGIFQTKRQKNRRHKAGNSIPFFGLTSHTFDVGVILYFILMMYYILGIISFLFVIKSSPPTYKFSKSVYFAHSSPIALNALLKNWYSILIVFLINRIIKKGNVSSFRAYLKLSWSSSCRLSILNSKDNRFHRLLSGLFCWLCLINLALIIIINPSLLNPGPKFPKSKDLTVAFQNVTGLIPFKELGKTHPTLDTIKIHI